MNGGLPHTGKKIENYVFNYSDFLGNGNFSKCYKATNTKTTEEVAIKIVELNSLKSKKLEELLFSEIEVLKEMHHPHVLRCQEVFTSNRNCYIITELCNEGDLETKVKKRGKLEDHEIRTIITDVFKGLQYLASKNIIHRDLKIANVFLNNGVAKIADFGFALHCTANFRDLNIGSPLYMAPEGILHNMYGPKTDVWAFGVMVYELYHGHTPFSYCQTEQDLRTSVVMPLQWHQLKAELPHDVKELILSCMEVREEKRPTIQQLASKTFLLNALQNRDMQTSSELRFRSPLKVNGRLMEFEESKRGSSKMKVRSAFSTQEESLGQRNLSKNISPNKSFFSNGTNMNGSIQINNKSVLEPQPQPNSSFINQTIISIQAPTQPKRSSTTDRQSSTFHSLRSPLDQSLNSTQPIQTSIICNRSSCLVSTQISFKESVSLLHYCRLIFKYLQCFKEFNSLKEQSEKEHYAILAHFLVIILDQIYAEVVNKKIRYEGDNPELREKKLMEVTEEYRKKYNKELDKEIIKISLPEKAKLEPSLARIAQTAMTFSNTSPPHDKSPQEHILIAELLLTIFSSSILLEDCYIRRCFTPIHKYKEIEEILNRSRDSFTFSQYSKHRNRVLPVKMNSR